jgi:hypothetical protein
MNNTQQKYCKTSEHLNSQTAGDLQMNAEEVPQPLLFTSFFPNSLCTTHPTILVCADIIINYK